MKAVCNHCGSTKLIQDVATVDLGHGNAKKSFYTH